MFPCLVAAEQLLRERHSGQTIVIADSGMKYLSTDLWDPGYPDGSSSP